MTERLVKINMSPKTSKQFEEIRQSRKAAIVETALELFANKGFAGISISNIAQKAGISKGLLYNYFENKESLVREIILEGFRQMLKDLDFDFRQKLTKKRFIELIHKNFDMLKQNTNYLKLYTTVITQPAVMALVKEEDFKAAEPFIISVTAYYQKKGVQNPLAYSYLIWAILDGIGLDYMFDPEHYPLEEIRNIIIEKFV